MRAIPSVASSEGEPVQWCLPPLRQQIGTLDETSAASDAGSTVVQPMRSNAIVAKIRRMNFQWKSTP
jgi:hypothetical protein